MSEKKKPGCLKLLFGAVIWFFLIGVAFTSCMSFVDSLPPPSPQPTRSGPTVLRTDDPSIPVLVGSSSEAYDAALTCLANGDQTGLDEMIAADLAAYIPAGTPVQVVNKGFLQTSVRLMGSEFEGNTVWTAREFVRD